MHERAPDHLAPDCETVALGDVIGGQPDEARSGRRSAHRRSTDGGTTNPGSGSAKQSSIKKSLWPTDSAPEIGVKGPDGQTISCQDKPQFPLAQASARRDW